MLVSAASKTIDILCSYTRWFISQLTERMLLFGGSCALTSSIRLNMIQ